MSHQAEKGLSVTSMAEKRSARVSSLRPLRRSPDITIKV